MNQPTLRKTQSAAPRDPTLRDLIVPLFRHKRPLAISFLLFLVGTIVAATVMSGQYKASLEILVNRQRLDPLVTAESTVQTPPNTPPAAGGGCLGALRSG